MDDEPTEPSDITPEPETFRQCPDCKEDAYLRRSCRWCFGLGIVDERQFENWKAYMDARRAASGTHNIIETFVRDDLRLLEESKKPGARVYIDRAKDLLDRWQAAAYDAEKRRAVTGDIITFHRSVQEFLLKQSSGPGPR